MFRCVTDDVAEALDRVIAHVSSSISPWTTRSCKIKIIPLLQDADGCFCSHDLVLPYVVVL